MMILDLLLQIEKLEDAQQQETFAEGLYKTNRKFAQLCDLCYRRSLISRYSEDEAFPLYTNDPVPYGYNYAQVEIIYNKLRVAGFTELGNERSLPDAIAEKKLIQLFESISDIEQQFIKYVLRKEIPWFNREAWKRAKHTD